MPADILDTLCTTCVLGAAWCSTVNLQPFSSTATALAKQYDSIFIPSRCIGTLTLGVVIISKPGEDSVRVGRFVRDDSDGSLFILISSTTTTSVDVYRIVHHGSMRIQKSHLRFSSFPDYTHALLGLEHDISDKVSVSFQSRPCYMCQSADDLKICSCQLSFISPSAPMEFSPFRANMEAFVGAYNGILYQVTPASILPEEIAYRSTIAPLNNPHMFSSMVQLAIQAIISSQPPLSTSITDGKPTSTAQPLFFQPSILTYISSSLSPFSPTGEIDIPPPFSLNGIQVSWSSSFEESVEDILKFQTAVPHIHMQVKKDIPNRPSSSKNKTAASNKVKGTIRKKKRKLTEEELAEREARRELRITKNRQAAARSNLRRKQQNDSLKAALAAARNRALQLRDRHLKLREENLSLKIALFAPDVPGPTSTISLEEFSMLSQGIEQRSVKC